MAAEHHSSKDARKLAPVSFALALNDAIILIEIGSQIEMNINLLILSVVSIWGVAVITRGPNLFITLQTSVKGSRLAGIFVVLGTCTGTIIWSITGYLGIAYLFNTLPWIYTVLKVIGGSYIIYLGVISIISSGNSSAKSHVLEERSQNFYRGYWKGLLTNLSNPKTAMFITSLFASVLPNLILCEDSL